MANPATLGDVEARWRPLTADEQITTQTLMDDTWAMLTGRLSALEANLTAGTVSPANVVRVVCAIVVRVLRNPEGLLEEQSDDYRYRRDQAVSTGQLFVTDQEIADLSPGYAGTRSALTVGVRPVGYGVTYP